MLSIFDPVLLSRIQFGFVAAFHIIFPAFTIGLASWLMVLEGLWLKTKHPIYHEIYQQWVKIFAVSFGLGVVSGVVMSYQFGTNWSAFSLKTGNVLGPILAFEVLTAFFLEASFLGIMLFGENRVGPKMHFFSTIMVAVGTSVSAFWILSANSWMHTPQGFRLDPDGLFYATNWFDVVFNPSFIPRLFHTLMAAFLTTAFVVSGVGAWYLVKNRFVAHARIMLTMGMLLAMLVVPLQLIVGHEHGLNTLAHQPVKVSAMEGLWETASGADLTLFGWPNEETQTTDYAVKIPRIGSLILTGDLDGEVKGLNAFPPSERPPVLPVFLAFRVMVGIGMLMGLTALFGMYLCYKKRLFLSKNFHRWCVLMIPSGFVAVLAGWVVTEVGRQPYSVYGQLRTAVASSAVSAYEVTVSLFAFIGVYTFIFGAGIYYLLKLIRKGPKIGTWHDTYGAHGMKYPLSIADAFLKHPNGDNHV